MAVKISVITIVKNRENTITRCLDSVLKQSYSDIECIVQDGVSTDSTLLKLKRYTNHWIKVESKTDSGLYDALNRAIERATGDYICFLHSDDFFANTEILELVSNKISRYRPDILYGDVNFVTSEEETVRTWVAGNFNRSKLKFGWIPPHTSLFIKRTKIMEVGNFNTQYKISADYDHTLRIINDHNTKVCYLPHCITYMTIGGASNGSLKKEFIKFKEDFLVCFHNRLLFGFTCVLKRLRKLPQFIRYKYR